MLAQVIDQFSDPYYCATGLFLDSLFTLALFRLRCQRVLTSSGEINVRKGSSLIPIHSDLYNEAHLSTYLSYLIFVTCCKSNVSLDWQ